MGVEVNFKCFKGEKKFGRFIGMAAPLFSLELVSALFVAYTGLTAKPSKSCSKVRSKREVQGVKQSYLFLDIFFFH